MTPHQALLEQGYVVFPGLLDASELATLRDGIDRHFRAGGNTFKLGKTQPNAAVLVPAVQPLLSDARVVRAFRAALGIETPVFTGHCDVHKGMFSGWHKDTGPHHGYFTDDCFATPCAVYKMGIYLQDSTDGEGLTVVPGSHREPHIREDGAVQLDTRAGDAIVFDVRLTHRGKTSDRVDKLLYRANQLAKLAVARVRRRSVAKDDYGFAYKLRQLYDRMTGRPLRHSIFFTFGEAGALTEQFAAANWVRQGDQNRAAATLPPALIAGLRSEGATVAAAVL